MAQGNSHASFWFGFGMISTIWTANMQGLNEIGDQGAVTVAKAPDLEKYVGKVMGVGLWRIASEILRLCAITTRCPS